MRCTGWIVFCVIATALPARADDWPQWLGPRRDGVWRETAVLGALPPGGPSVRWRAAVAGGYAGPAVADGRVYVTDWTPAPGARPAPDASGRRVRAGRERVLCLRESDGSVLWTHEYDCPYGIDYGSGPRATPLVEGDRVYSLGAEGHLTCLDAAGGKVHWTVRVAGGDAGPVPEWGMAAHPLIEGNAVITLSGRPDGVAAAFDKMTGRPLWTALSARGPGYCPPMAFDAAGVRQLIVWHPEAVNSLDPKTGRVYWSVPHGPVENDVSIATPRLFRDQKLGDLLVVSDAWNGTTVLKLDGEGGKPTAQVLWRRGGGRSAREKDVLHSLMAAPFVRDGHLYGVHNQGHLRCLDALTGDVKWESLAPTTGTDEGAIWATAFLIPHDSAGNERNSRVFIANERGDLILADLTPAGYREVSRAKLLAPTNTDAGRPVLWSHPAFANRSVYWRNDRELVCASLADGAAGQ